MARLRKVTETSATKKTPEELKRILQLHESGAGNAQIAEMEQVQLGSVDYYIGLALLDRIPKPNQRYVRDLSRLMPRNEKAAAKLVGRFGSLYGVITADWTDIVGIAGGDWQEQFFQRIGRGS